MKLLSTRVHGVLDYLVSLVLIAAPWLLHFDPTGPETIVPVILGTSSIVYSLITDYELSIARVISMRTHLALDVLSGILLAASPWIFDFHDAVFLPHLMAGIIEIAVALRTERKPSNSKTAVSQTPIR